MKFIYSAGFISLALLLMAVPASRLAATYAFGQPIPSTEVKKQFSIDFFSAQVRLEFAPAMRIQLPTTNIDQASLEKASQQLASGPSEVLLASLLAAKKEYSLNDYLFFKLTDYALSFIYQGQQDAAKQLALFDLLNRAGFDIQLTYKQQQLYINAYTQDELFEVPLITHKARNYANLSCIANNCQQANALYVFNKKNESKGRPFSFQITSWPKLPPKVIDKTLSYTYLKETKQLHIRYDQTVVNIMKDYPFISEYCYVEAPLSATLAQSLLPLLQESMEGKTLAEKLALLAAFTRSAFPYQDDNIHFGRSKPMVPEEVFSYEYSDCEDRCALFFALSKELLDIPLLLIAYDDHLSLAVYSEDIPGDHFRYNNKRYIFCDPTGPVNSSEIGQIPNGYQNRPFEIIYAYK